MRKHLFIMCLFFVNISTAKDSPEALKRYQYARDYPSKVVTALNRDVSDESISVDVLSTLFSSKLEKNLSKLDDLKQNKCQAFFLVTEDTQVNKSTIVQQMKDICTKEREGIAFEIALHKTAETWVIDTLTKIDDPLAFDLDNTLLLDPDKFARIPKFHDVRTLYAFYLSSVEQHKPSSFINQLFSKMFHEDNPDYAHKNNIACRLHTLEDEYVIGTNGQLNYDISPNCEGNNERILQKVRVSAPNALQESETGFLIDSIVDVPYVEKSARAAYERSHVYQYPDTSTFSALRHYSERVIRGETWDEYKGLLSNRYISKVEKTVANLSKEKRTDFVDPISGLMKCHGSFSILPPSRRGDKTFTAFFETQDDCNKGEKKYLSVIFIFENDRWKVDIVKRFDDKKLLRNAN